MKRLAALLLLAMAFTLGWAKEAVPLAEDPVVEQRLVAISEEMRCLVCQNESLSASRSELAQDLRRELRTLIRQGKSDAEVMDYLVARYGDFVRYRPPLKPTTWLLWGGPLLFVLIGFGALAWHLRHRRQVDAALSADEQDEARRLLENS